jgi:capsular exopolysaccharide synthesis family protein
LSSRTYSSQSAERSSLDEARVDVRRYMAALRRSRLLMGMIIVIITGGVLALSLVLPERYKSTATILVDFDNGVLGTPDSTTVERSLQTLNALLLSSDVLNEAAKEVPGETPSTIAAATLSTVDPTANLIDITATSGDPETAAGMANAVAESFVEVQTDAERREFDQQIAKATQALNAAENDPSAAEQVPGLRDLVNNLTVQAETAGSGLRLASTAGPSGSPASPRPFRNTVLALFASLFIAVFVALGRDQIRPRLSDPRELSQVLGLPVLAGIPLVRRRFGRRDRIAEAVEHEAFETLRAGIQLAVPPGRNQVILVTSAVHAEGKTTVAARLGRALAGAGERTLLISADLRWPALHQSFGIPSEPGLSDLLRLAERAGISDHLLPAATHAIGRRGEDGDGPLLEVVASGHKPSDPARLLSSPATHAFFEYLRGFDYDYIIVDGPPMLGIADTQALAREADRTLLVTQLDRLTADHVIDMGELIERFDMRPVGIVVIGARVEVSPYYLSRRPGVFEGASEHETSTS